MPTHMPTRKPTRRNPRPALQAQDLVYLGDLLAEMDVKKVTATEARAIMRDVRDVESIPPSRRRHTAVLGLLEKLSRRFGMGGVMVIEGAKKVPFFRGNVALYIDAGDENQTTVVYDAVDNRFDLIAVGDFFFSDGKESYGMNETYGKIVRAHV